MAVWYSPRKKEMLRYLSENSRMSTTELAHRLKCQRNTVMSNMRSLEKELGMGYTLELNSSMLGFAQRYIISIKFGKQPSSEELKKIFEDDALAQFIAITEGDFDVLISVAANSGENYTRWASSLMQLLPYKPAMRRFVIGMEHAGYIPIPKSTLDNLTLLSPNIDRLDKEMLILLNENARYKYKELANRIHISEETIRYRYKKLLKSGIIRRFTVKMTRPPTDCNIAFFLNYRLTPSIMEESHRAYEYYVKVDADAPVVNTFQFLASMASSNSQFGIACTQDMDSAKSKVIDAYRGIYMEAEPKISFARIKEVIKGSMPMRSVDMKKEYSMLRSA